MPSDNSASAFEPRHVADRAFSCSVVTTTLLAAPEGFIPDALGRQLVEERTRKCSCGGLSEA